MKTLLAYARGLFEDPIFARACMFFWGLPLLLLAGFALLSWRPTAVWEWMAYALLVLLGWLGAYFVYVAVFGRDAALEKASNLVNDGGDIVGVVAALAVCAVALPVTAVIKALRSKSGKR